MPIGTLTRVKDFLPPPAKLVMPDENVKITISIKKSSRDFFKHEAEIHHTKYQRMIREVLDRYASLYRRAS
jgi:hypothetical protein